MAIELVSLWLAGLMGGVHCIGMCGGIVAALSMGGTPSWRLHLGYHAGRIVSYTLTGTLLTMIVAAFIQSADPSSDIATLLATQQPVRLAVNALANLMIIAAGIYVMGRTEVLRPFERVGSYLWRFIEPLGRRFLPVRRVKDACVLGLVWGFLPCGLIYAALIQAVSTLSPTRAALMMLVFALGTLPNLLAAAFALTRLRPWLQRPYWRTIAGTLMVVLGLWGLARMR